MTQTGATKSDPTRSVCCGNWWTSRWTPPCLHSTVTDWSTSKSRPHQYSKKYAFGSQDYYIVGQTHIAEYHRHTGAPVGHERESMTAGRRYAAGKESVPGPIPVLWYTAENHGQSRSQPASLYLLSSSDQVASVPRHWSQMSVPITGAKCGVRLC